MKTLVSWRSRVATVLSFVCVFLLSKFGWNPLLIVWGVNSLLACKEHPDSVAVKIVHGIIAALCFLLVCGNIIYRVMK